MKQRILILLITVLVWGGIAQANPIRTDLLMEYYVFYKRGNNDGETHLTEYRICATDSPDIYELRKERIRKWERDHDGIWVLRDDHTEIHPEALLKVEKRRVLLLPVAPYRFKMEYPFYFGIGPLEIDETLYRCDNAGVVAEVNPEDEKEVVLYDYGVKQGDRYESIIYGNLLAEVTVLNVFVREDLPDHPVQVDVIPSFALEFFKGSAREVELIKENTISYVEGFGNISLGFFTSFEATRLDASSDGSCFFRCLNNVYDADGKVVYQGYNDPGPSISRVGPISIKGDAFSSVIYDLHGRRVSHPVPGSVYIRGGKKYIAR